MKSHSIIYFSLIILLFIASNTHSQTLTFCESVDKYGKAVNPSDTFDVAADGGMLTVLVKPGHALNTSAISYEIYYFSDSVSLYNNTERKDVQKDWLFCWIHLFFKDEGKYRVRVLAEDNSLLGTGEVYIKTDKK